MTTTAYRAVSYVRLSHDKTGKAPSIDSQREINRQLAERYGVEIVAELTDRHESASAFRSQKYERPDWAKLLKGLKNGAWNVVLTPWWDRGSREGIIGLAEIIEHLPRTGRFITDNFGEMDLRTSHGRMLAAIIAEQAAAYSEAISEKTKVGLRRRALEGKPHGGGSSPYGHNRDGSVIRKEAAQIRQMQAWILEEGLSCSAVAMRLNQSGVTAKKGGPWSGSSIALLLKQTRLVGLNEAGKECWAPILTEDEHVSILAALAQTSGTRKHGVNGGENTLLRGLIKCPKCNQKLAFYVMENRGKLLPRYKCTKRFKGVPKHLQKGCEVSISQPFADECVVAKVAAVHGSALNPLKHSSDREALELKEALETEISDLQQREAAFTQEYIHGKSLDPATWQQGRQSFLDRIATAQAQLDVLEAVEPEEHVGPGPKENAAEWFASKKRTVEEKRAALRASLTEVWLHPAQGRSIEDRLEPRWRRERAFEIKEAIRTNKASLKTPKAS